MILVEPRIFRLLGVAALIAGTAMLSGCGPAPYTRTTTSEQTTTTTPRPMETTTTTTIEQGTRRP